MLNKEQMEALKPYEMQMHSAVYSQTLRGIGVRTTQMMQDLYNEATGADRHICQSCAKDVFELLKDVGKMYYDTLAAEVKPKRTNKKK